MNIFEQASKLKLRFASGTVGNITTEQLWDIPLTSKRATQIDLDQLAKEAHREVKETSEESFVKPKTNAKNVEAELRLEILKHVISVKLADADKKAKSLANYQEKQRLLAVLDRKNDQELEGMTKAQIEQKIAELNE